MSGHDLPKCPVTIYRNSRSRWAEIRTKWQDNNSDSDILEAIQEGPGAMPGYADKLSEAEQLALVRAVRDLRMP